jgi:hypothetical protein
MSDDGKVKEMLQNEVYLNELVDNAFLFLDFNKSG